MADNTHLPDTLAKVIERYENVTEGGKDIVRAAAIDAYFVGKFDGINHLAKAYRETDAKMLGASGEAA